MHKSKDEYAKLNLRKCVYAFSIDDMSNWKIRTAIAYELTHTMAPLQSLVSAFKVQFEYKSPSVMLPLHKKEFKRTQWEADHRFTLGKSKWINRKYL